MKNHKCNVANTGTANTVLWELFLLSEKSVPYALNWSKKCCNVQDIYTGINRKIRLMHLTEKRSKYRETRFCMGLLEDRVDG